MRTFPFFSRQRSQARATLLRGGSFDPAAAIIWSFEIFECNMAVRPVLQFGETGRWRLCGKPSKICCALESGAVEVEYCVRGGVGGYCLMDGRFYFLFAFGWMEKDRQSVRVRQAGRAAAELTWKLRLRSYTMRED